MDKFGTINWLFGSIPESNFILSGTGWGIEKVDNNYVLSFISGEHFGKEKRIEINEEDFNLLKDGKVDINDIFIKYHTG
ncbi:hypothetical protein HYE60_01925 [Aggregatibacter actinomycetemcomitans]|uniref:hypothetical protein n=1 Tax=Aggregatibacter actinomycetemcomitans TaxID=714 RepID=UPI00197BE748|nr:hypothetical protein [Aggregatibacter actinomycetemcomitans]MBN6074022.1 hypothetical protein [Aggregatibacter actinomycetemcomitans]